MSTVIRAEDLCVTLKIPRRPEKELVRHVNFEVQRGECLGILGESGSGKSMSIKAMLGLLDKNFSVSGHAWFGEKDLLKESGESMRKIRGSEIAVVLQNHSTESEARSGRHLRHTRTGMRTRSERSHWRHWNACGSAIRRRRFRNTRISSPAACCRGS